MSQIILYVLENEDGTHGELESYDRETAERYGRRFKMRVVMETYVYDDREVIYDPWEEDISARTARVNAELFGD